MVDQIRSFLDNHKLSLAIGGSVAALGLARWVMCRPQAVNFGPFEGETDRATFTKKNHVYLMVPPKLGAVPNISPFSMKVETWLRMVNIPYETVETMTPSTSTQTLPYIYLNGVETTDSAIIIERCARHFGKPVNKHLTEMEKAIFVAFTRMLEEHTCYTYAWYRYDRGADQFWGNFLPPDKLSKLGKALLGFREFMKKHIVEKTWVRGIGRHAPEQIYSMAEDDLRSISVYLGHRDFFFGREPSLIDCTLFAHLIQILCIKTEFPPGKKVLTDYKNLERYVERMKARFFPDWNHLCNPQFE